MNQIDVQKLFKQWCKETKRSGGILVGASIREFLDYLQKYMDEQKQKSTH